MIKTERLYNLSPENPSYKILVDRLWPRGVKKEDPRIDEWKKEVAPSNELRKWFNHQKERWPDFIKHYTKELQNKKEVVDELKTLITNKNDVILLYTAKDTIHNHAVVLKNFIKTNQSYER